MSTQPTSETNPQHCHLCKETLSGPHTIASNLKFHPDCFVCHQCLEPLMNNSYFEAESRFFCEFDYSVLHGARCGRCGEIIAGKCITAMDTKWHPDHFTCEMCGNTLAGTTFVKRNGKPYCKPCNERCKLKEKQDVSDLCERCKKPITSVSELLLLRGQKYHAHHFDCVQCKQTLTPACKEYEGKLYCLPDYERITTRVCFACRRPIVGRSVTALGKQFHIEHFVCSKCEKPFTGSIYWEHGGKPFCEYHYHELTGEVCGHCHEPVTGKVVTALDRKWCEHHFMCMGCHTNLTSKDKEKDTKPTTFLEMDYKPFCKRCFEALSVDVRKNLQKYLEVDKKVATAAALLLPNKK